MPTDKKKKRPTKIPALRVQQWLDTWDDVLFDPAEHRRRPPGHFYLFTISASQLRALSGIRRRSTKGKTARKADLGVQRRHDEGRSMEIAQFVRRGYPWSSLSKTKQRSGDFDDLIKPGWLPTALVVNILTPKDDRQGETVAQSDLISISDAETLSTIHLPATTSDVRWTPTKLPPIEIIDGQHRLWAFEETSELDGEFELPVVAFYGLDISWQAYLFYVINIKPKKINTSLAYDLYPLLRTEDWLDRVEGLPVYRETRAQELTEALWSYADSPWHDRIDMLGEGGRQAVSQAAWIRSLTATFIKSWEGRRVQIGGLFGSRMGEENAVLPWTRAQQAAFVIHLWSELEVAIGDCDAEWAEVLREAEPEEVLGGDAAFRGSKTLPNTDQGVRAIMAVVNDLCWVRSEALNLRAWPEGAFSDGTSTIGIGDSLKSLKKQDVGVFVADVMRSLASYDFRTYSAPGLNEEQRNSKARFRGGTGYRELRRDLLLWLAESTDEISEAANDVLEILER
ncbi:MAG: DGQHR domain-containing protein [Acidimicrobiales bacterium]|nr:DGQHR domain-containing protein [Acidimicrobiales bacterium]